MIDLFGKVPVHMRQWVRHMIALPDPNGGHAYNSNGNIAMFNIIDGDVTVFIHETGHSLDLLGAYTDKPLSSSNYWLTQYADDSNVPDPYAQSNQVENVAQNTVVATFNENVPGGFDTVEKNGGAIFHQYATLQTEADAADPGNILKPGGKCTRRLENSTPVQQGGPTEVGVGAAVSAVAGLVSGVPPPSSRIMRRGQAAPMPDVSLADHIKVIPAVKFDTKAQCKHTW